MKSDVIKIDNRGSGFKEALIQTEKVAVFKELTKKETLQLCLCTEEMLSLVRSVTGEVDALFWIENDINKYDLHLSTKTVMDREKRNNLLASATSRKNEAANTFLGMLRDTFEAAMLSDPEIGDIPDEVMGDMVNRSIEIPEWDEYEQSILKSVSNEVRIAIRGGMVDMTVTKIY